jgi:hypothetical protein
MNNIIIYDSIILKKVLPIFGRTFIHIQRICSLQVRTRVDTLLSVNGQAPAPPTLPMAFQLAA